MSGLMQFYENLADRGLSSILNRTVYEYVPYSQDKRFFEYMDDMVLNNRKTLIYGDYDVDGLMCALTARDSLSLLGHTNHTVYRYRDRTHKLDYQAVQKAIDEEFEYMIICDTGMSDLGQLDRLEFFGIKTIVLDHHRTTNTYADFPKTCVCINTIIENRLCGEEKFILSAGALVFTLFNEYLKMKGIKENNLASYALCSLYADCVDMSTKLCRGIYYKAVDMDRYSLPRYFQNFLNEHQVFCRRFIEFRFSPHINALIRAERFDILNEYIFSEKANKTMTILNLMERLYQENREMVSTVSDIISYDEMDTLVLATMSGSVDRHVPILENKLYNYTGLVANKLSGRFKKPCVVLCSTGKDIKGSFRDIYSRDYLSLFKTFCDSDGHSAAFGIKLNYRNFNDFEKTLGLVSDKFYIDNISNKPIIIEKEAPLTARELTDLAMYNEFSGNKIPTVLIQKSITGLREYKSSYDYRYAWGDYSIISETRLLNGTKALCKPTKRKSLSLIVV